MYRVNDTDENLQTRNVRFRIGDNKISNLFPRSATVRFKTGPIIVRFSNLNILVESRNYHESSGSIG